MTINKSKIGKHIAMLRKNINITQQQLAEKLYVSYQAVSKWERGLSTPDIEMLQRISEVLSVNFTSFLLDIKYQSNVSSIFNNFNEMKFHINDFMQLELHFKAKILNESDFEIIDNYELRNTLRSIYLNVDEFINNENNSLFSTLFDKLSDLIDLNYFTEKQIVINNIRAIILEIDEDYSFPLIRRICKKLISLNQDTFVFVANYTTDKNRLNFVAMTTQYLTEKGVNCLMALSLAKMAALNPSAVEMISHGGGNCMWGHHDIINPEINLRDNALEIAFDMVKKYLENYNKKYRLELVKD